MKTNKATNTQTTTSVKPKRIKHVFTSSSQVLHVWANQSQDHGRQGGRITRCYFQGNSCYSYGSHYELGRLVEYKGHTVALINTRGYSNTTTKHIREASAAVSHLINIETKGITTVEDALLQTQSRLIDKLMGNFNRRSFYQSPFTPGDCFSNELNQFNSACQTLGFSRLVLAIPQDLKDLVNAHVAKCKAHMKVLDTIKLLRRQGKQLEDALKVKEQLAAWQSGTGPLTNLITDIRPMLIRIIGDTVQTSGGAEVPLVEARALLAQLNTHKVPSGTKIGSFEFQSMKDGLVTIGCHTISIDEAKKVLGGSK